MYMVFLALCFLGVSLPILSEADPQELILRYGFKKGMIDKYKVVVDIKSIVRKPDSNVKREFTQEVERILTQKIEDIDQAGVAEISITNKTLKTKTSMDGKEFTFEGIQGTEDSVESSKQGIDLPPISMWMDNRGKVLRVKGLESINNTIYNNESSPAFNTATRVYDNINNEMAGAFSDIYLFPETGVKVGDSWTRKAETPFQDAGLAKARITLTYTFQGLEQVSGHKCAKIDMVLQLTSDEIVTELENIKRTTITSGRIDMVLFFDHEKGKIIGSDEKIKIQTHTTIEIPVTDISTIKEVFLGEITATQHTNLL